MNTNKDTSKNINNEKRYDKVVNNLKKHCFFHEVYCGTYDCNYCGEYHECLSSECCYAFNELTKTSEDLEQKIKRILKNFQEGWDKENGNIEMFKTVRSDVLDEFQDVVYLLIDEDKKNIYPFFVENFLLRMSFNELNWLHYHYVNTKFFTTLRGMTLHQMYRFVVELDTIKEWDIIAEREEFLREE